MRRVEIFLFSASALFVVIMLVLLVIPNKNSGKTYKTIPKYRHDYKYSEEAHAFYKIYLERTYIFEAERRCHRDGAELISSDKQDLTIAQKLHEGFGKEGDIISFVAHNNNYGYANCRVVESNGQLRDEDCFSNVDSFVCKVQANRVQYDERCKTFNILNEKVLEYTPNVALGSCYSMPDYSLSWQEAEERCELDGGHLVVINSQLEANFVRDFVRDKNDNAAPHSVNPTYLAIGFSFSHRDEDGQRVFTSVFGRTLAEEGYETWAPGEPSNYNEMEDCGSWFANDPGLNDANCDYVRGFVCEKEMHCECCTPKCLRKQ